jgi:cohesin complex subunit SA-1/2
MDAIASASASATPEPDENSRRRSGRVVKVPAKYAPEPANNAAPKRKRGEQGGEELDEDEVESDEEMSNEDNASDEDHPAPRSRKTGRTKKPSSKKPKINGAQPSGPTQISRIPSRPKKTVRIEAGEKGTGLFGMFM